MVPLSTISSNHMPVGLGFVIFLFHFMYYLNSVLFFHLRTRLSCCTEYFGIYQFRVDNCILIIYYAIKVLFLYFLQIQMWFMPEEKKYSIFYETKSFEGLLKGYFAHGKAEKAKDYSVVQRRDIIL